ATAAAPGAVPRRAAARAPGGGAPAPPASGRRRRARRSPEPWSTQLSFQHGRKPREPTARARLDGPERDAEERRDLTLRETAPVRKLQHRALVIGQRTERAMDVPRELGRLGALRRPRLPGRLVRVLGERFPARAGAVDDRVAGDRVKPG